MVGTRLMAPALALVISVACGGSTDERDEVGSGATSTGGSAATSGGAPSISTGGTGGTSGATGGAGAGGNGGGAPSSEACTAPMEYGDCEAAILRWWHDPDTGVCVPFYYGGCGGNANNHETLDACHAACAGHDGELDACETYADCAVVSAGCCGICEPVSEGGVVAVNVDYTDTFREVLGCGDVLCEACEERPAAERTGQNFYAACVGGQCTVRDVRQQPFTECSVAEDCRLRCGAGCCTSCGSGEDVIAIRADTDDHAEFCGGDPTECPTCDCTIPENYEAACDGGRCVVRGLGVCTPGLDQTCNGDLFMSALAGTCNDDGTCTCKSGYTQDPDSGLCY